MKTLNLPLMVFNYAKMFGVTVRIQGSCAYTNGKVITIPRLDVTKPNITRLALGYLAHESAHIRYTDFSILKKDKIKNNLFLFSLFNILEDARIETLISKEYIGVYENLELLNNYYKEDWTYFCKTLNSISVLNVVCAFIQCYSQCLFQKFECSKVKATLLYWHLRNRIDVHVLNKIGKLVQECSHAQDSESVYKICLKIFSLLKNSDNKTFKGKNPVNSSEENDENFQNIMEESKKNFNKAKDKVTADFLKEFTKFRIATGDDDSKVTPSRNGAEIIQENSNSKCTSSREDFGVLENRRTDKGSDDFIKEVSKSYGLRNALRSNVLAYVDFYRGCSEVGRKINPFKAQRVCVGETNIFKHSERLLDYSTDIAICVDISSSMLTEDDGAGLARYECANRVALSLALALENIDGISTCVNYFPCQCGEFATALKFGEKASVMAPYFDQKPTGSTPLAQCLWKTFDMLETREANRSIVICISDGMPDSCKNTKICFDYAKQHGIDIYGISIRSEAILKLFDKAVIVENEKELYTKAFSILNKLFEVKRSERRLLDVA